MADVIIYRTQWCPYCRRAEALLAEKKQHISMQITLIDIEQHPEQRAEMMRLSGRRSVPQIFVNQMALGGYDDLAALDQQGKLDNLLKAPSLTTKLS